MRGSRGEEQTESRRREVKLDGFARVKMRREERKMNQDEI